MISSSTDSGKALQDTAATQAASANGHLTFTLNGVARTQRQQWVRDGLVAEMPVSYTHLTLPTSDLV